ncbi:hypothetical protein KW796_01960 [Candidatus Parcubacteria bacterium]|nr:hypothetical protein [Candidatus Parcubacteria bacterium]
MTAKTKSKPKKRKMPGTGGRGRFYRIVVRPKYEFSNFRIQDVGSKGHLERLAGERPSGSWDTVSWLISKDDADIRSGKLVITNSKVKKSLDKAIRGPITHVKGDVFHAYPRKNVPEKSKPTKAMRAAQKKNIKKAQSARKKGK